MAKRGNDEGHVHGEKESPGHLYIQTNEIENAINPLRAKGATGALYRGGKRIGHAWVQASGEFKPISGPRKRTQRFLRAREASSSHRIDVFLFTTNGGDNSVFEFPL